MHSYCASNPTPLQLHTFSTICHSATRTFLQHDILLAFLNRSSSSTLNGWSISLSVKDSFWIRNEFQIFSYCSAPDIGSAYGNQPCRSFREKTVSPRRACSHIQRQYARQHTREHIGASHFLHSIVLLWRRPGWRRVLALCSVQRPSQPFIPGLLWRRPRWWRVLAVRASQGSLQHRIFAQDARTILLRRRSWWRRITAHYRVAASDANPYTLMASGRLSIQRGGQ